MVHRLSDLRDSGQTLYREVKSALHHPDDPRELFELITFRRDQWIFLEERHDSIPKVLEPEDPVDVEIFPMVVAPSVSIEAAAAEVLSNDFERVNAALSLDNRETRLHLPSDPVRRIPIDRNTEAALAVDEADDPLLDSWPFLLIARTRRIVTSHACTVLRGTDMTGTAGCSGVPAYSQLHSRRHRREGQRAEAVTHLRSP